MVNYEEWISQKYMHAWKVQKCSRYIHTYIHIHAQMMHSGVSHGKAGKTEFLAAIEKKFNKSSHEMEGMHCHNCAHVCICIYVCIMSFELALEVEFEMPSALLKYDCICTCHMHTYIHAYSAKAWRELPIIYMCRNAYMYDFIHTYACMHAYTYTY
jgi:hypothetical protein